MSNAIPNLLRMEKPAPRVEPPYLTAFAEWLPSLRAAWRVAQQYPPEHPQVTQQIHASFALLLRGLEQKNPLTCVALERTLSVDGLTLEERRAGVLEAAESMLRLGMRALTFFQGVTESDLRELVAIMAADPRELLERGGGARELARRGVMKIRATPVKQAEVATDSGEREETAPPEDRLRKLGAVTADQLRLTGQLTAEAATLPEELGGGGSARVETALIRFLGGHTEELSDHHYFQLLTALDDPERLHELLIALVADHFASGALQPGESALIAQTVSRIARLLRERSPEVWSDCKQKLAEALVQLGDPAAAGVFAAATGLDEELARALDEVCREVAETDAARVLAHACAQPQTNPSLLSAMFSRLGGEEERCRSVAALVQETLQKVHGASGLYSETLEPIFVEIMSAHLGGDAGLEASLLALRGHRPRADRAAEIHAEIHDLLEQSEALSPQAEAVNTLIELLEFETDPTEYQSLLTTTRETLGPLLGDHAYDLLRELIATVRRHAETKPSAVSEQAREFCRSLVEDTQLQTRFFRLLFEEGEPRAQAVVGLLDELLGDVTPLLTKVLADPRCALAAEVPDVPSQRLRLQRRALHLLAGLREDRGWNGIIEIATRTQLTREAVLLRREALRMLATGDRPAVVATLAGVLRRRTLWRRGLNELLRAEAAESLTHLLDSPEPAVAQAARQTLRTANHDRNPAVRLAAAKAR